MSTIGEIGDFTGEAAPLIPSAIAVGLLARKAAQGRALATPAFDPLKGGRSYQTGASAFSDTLESQAATAAAYRSSLSGGRVPEPKLIEARASMSPGKAYEESLAVGRNYQDSVIRSSQAQAKQVEANQAYQASLSRGRIPVGTLKNIAKKVGKVARKL